LDNEFAHTSWVLQTDGKHATFSIKPQAAKHRMRVHVAHHKPQPISGLVTGHCLLSLLLLAASLVVLAVLPASTGVGSQASRR
jgi:acyl-coenzyme A thioesterase PaaI-like protein